MTLFKSIFSFCVIVAILQLEISPSIIRSEESDIRNSIGAFRNGRRSNSWRTVNSQVAKSSKRLYKLFLPTTTVTAISEDLDGSEAIIEFKPDVLTLENMTRATLDLTLTPSTIDNSEFPITLFARYQPTTGESLPSTSTHIGTFFSGPELTKISIDVLPYLETITAAILHEGDSHPRMTPRIIRLSFIARRICNNVEVENCTPILDVVSKTPYLKVCYTNEIQPSVDAEIDALLMALRN